MAKSLPSISCVFGTDSINEEDVEPKFKYQRLANDLKNMLNADVISCSAVHLKDVFIYLTIKETLSTQI
ncbi:uncharacterized protein LOC6539249 isoform X7 [Drosophila yakuba]|uniref:uncharacterized protein LOC6539249 isoform X7 n=1 Tax=Drosophila yakuba TaxID=7245 RepID=UPI00193082B5|nr:uncharacterized protein LOC6539249 isoform X7 [Drosophila yakuba]